MLMQRVDDSADGWSGSEGSGQVLDDVADALTRNQDVEWERCAKLAAPGDRRPLDNLRALARAVSARDATAEETPATGLASFSNRRVRRAAAALLVIASLEVSAAMLLLPWAWGDYHRDHGDFAVFSATRLVGYGVSACLLLFAGRREQRSWLLGFFCLLKGTASSALMLPAFLLEMSPPEMYSEFLREIPESTKLFAYLHIPSFLFAPALLWGFARECPRVHRRTRLDDFARRMVQVSVAIGFAIWAVGMIAGELAQAGHAWVPLEVIHDGHLVIVDVLTLGAVGVVAMRARTAHPDEVRRIAVFTTGMLAFVGLAAGYNLAELSSPGIWVSNYRWSPTGAVIEILRFPGVVLLWYSVLAARVPHPREVVRTCCRLLLMRPWLLGSAAVAAAVSLGSRVAGNSERQVGAVIADPLAQALFATAAALVLVLVCREPILRRLDAWAHPESRDQQHALAAAAAALGRARSVRTVNRTVVRAAMRGCGSAAALAAGRGPGSHPFAFQAQDARIRPLPRASAIVRMLGAAGGTLRVHPKDKASLFALLPQDDAAWVAEANADAIVTVPGADGELIGVLVVGRRYDDRLVRAADLPFLEALGAAAGLALGRLWAAVPAGSAQPEAPPARECPVCRTLSTAGDPPGCGCGSAYIEAGVPAVLAGKFQLVRRLGAGGMGAAYLARDMGLERNVAVKALTGPAAFRPAGLKPEAWAMAEVTHPAVAQVHGIESWRGQAFLVVEFLAGGTLADRLRRGPVPGPDAVSIAAELAGALAALHEAGYVHGDVKPSNVGLTSGGSPKLLDFGLARAPNDSAVAGGTLSYASPEVVSGRPAAEADDVWSLCVVLYEMVTGEHPFAGEGFDELARRIRRRRIVSRGRPTAGGGLSASLIAFAASVLAAGRAARPATARAFAEALREVVA